MKLYFGTLLNFANFRSIPLRNRLTGHRTNLIESTQPNFRLKVDVVRGCVLTDALTSLYLPVAARYGLTSPSARRRSLLEYIYTQQLTALHPHTLRGNGSFSCACQLKRFRSHFLQASSAVKCDVTKVSGTCQTSAIGQLAMCT